jgi:hypothetical protein
MTSPLKCFLVFTGHPTGVTKICAYFAVAAEEAEAIELIQQGYRDFMVTGELAWIGAEYRTSAADIIGIPVHQSGYTSPVSRHLINS